MINTILHLLDRWYMLFIFVIILLAAIVITPTNAQKAGNTKEDVSARASEPLKDIVSDTAQAPSETDTNDIIADTSNTPRRVRPEHPYYFIANYTQRFDDNVSLSREDSKSDLIYLPEIGFGIVRASAHSLMRLDYLGGAEIHQRFSDLNGALHVLDAGLEYDLTKRFLIFANNQYLQRPQTAGLSPFTTSPVLGAPAFNVLTASRSIHNNFNIGSTYQLSKFSNLRAAYSYTIARFREQRLIDTDAHSLEVSYTRQMSKTRSYSLEYRTDIYNKGRDLITHTLLPGLRYRRAGLLLRIGVGPQIVNSARNDAKFSWAALAEIGYRRERMAYGLTYTSGVGTSGGLAAATRNHSLYGTVEYIFSERWETAIRLGYSRAYNSQALIPSPLLPTGFTNNELIFENRTSYRAGDRFTVFFDYLHSRQYGSGVAIADLNRNRFSIGIRFDTRRSVSPMRTAHKRVGS
ncbi:MAG: hypothetical protein AB1489_06250 [Acidobacteriota bacterium]